MTDANSPTAQLRLTTTAGEGWKYDYVGRLRLDMIQFREVAIPDSHLFDGVALLQYEPSALVREVRRVSDLLVSPLIVNCRGRSLDASLRELLVRRDKPDTLNGFVFKAIGGGDASRQMARAIAAASSERLSQFLSGRTTVDGVCSFLTSLALNEGIDIDGPIETMRRGWAAWIRAANDGVIQAEPWRGRFDTATAARRTFHDPADYATTYHHFEKVYQMFCRPRSFSSDIDEYLAEAIAGASATERAEIALIKEWEREVRGKALAMRHRCAYRVSIDDSAGKLSLWRRLTSRSETSGAQIDYPESFVHRLGRLDAATFRGSLNFDDLEDWWQRGDRDALKRVAGRLSDAVESNVEVGLHNTPRGINLIEVDYKTVAAAATGSLVGGLVAGPAGAAIGAAATPLVEQVLGIAGRDHAKRRKNVRLVTEYFDATTHAAR